MVVDEKTSDKNQSRLFCDNVIITATAKARVEHSNALKCVTMDGIDHQ